jgi:hypothetical protein
MPVGYLDPAPDVRTEDGLREREIGLVRYRPHARPTSAPSDSGLGRSMENDLRSTHEALERAFPVQLSDIG